MKSFAILLIVGLALTLGCSNDSKDNGPTGTANHAPVIRSITAYPSTISRNETTEIAAIVTDEDSGSVNLEYYWTCRGGQLTDRSGSSARWLASSEPGTYYVALTASDGKAIDTDSVAISVTSIPQNTPPTRPYAPDPPDYSDRQPLSLDLTWGCDDADGDSLEYDVYFGTDSQLESLIFVRRDLTTKLTSVTDLRSTQDYYWKIIVRDGRGADVTGPVWAFWTQ